MSSFRKYGGVNRSAIGNIVRHHYANETNTTISNSTGLNNSKILSQSHIDMSCNSILNVQSIYFCDGTTLSNGGTFVPNGTTYSDYLYWDPSGSAWAVGNSKVHLGTNAGQSNQGANAVALGSEAGRTTQGANAVALGSEAGKTTQGANAVAIGYRAGSSSQPANSIVINASGSALNGTDASACYVKPIRNLQSSQILTYDPSSCEITYNAANLTSDTLLLEHTLQTYPWVAVGSGTNSIAYSSDGISWIPATNIFSTYGYDVAYSAQQNTWVAVGATTNTIAYSTNGTSWTGIGKLIHGSLLVRGQIVLLILAME
jgi:hypothetical protein